MCKIEDKINCHKQFKLFFNQYTIITILHENVFAI